MISLKKKPFVQIKTAKTQKHIYCSNFAAHCLSEKLLPQLQRFYRCTDRHHRNSAFQAVRPIRYYRQHRLQLTHIRRKMAYGYQPQTQGLYAVQHSLLYEQRTARQGQYDGIGSCSTQGRTGKVRARILQGCGYNRKQCG